MAQKFYVDDLIIDLNLLSAVKSFGGDTLSRITVANPCHDTISFARNGDTIKCEDYLWMLLHLNNDTSVVSASEYLTIFYQNSIVIAQPNFLYQKSITPNDGYFVYQTSLHTRMIGAERAWDFETGNHGKKIGIIDDGLDYRHCDLGTQVGLDKKVTGGWNWTENNQNFYNLSEHGTQCAGVAGALTNGTAEACPELGIAGIAGGWGDVQGGGPIGCQLMGFRVAVPGDNEHFETSFIIAAVREASAYYPPYGYGVHILNNSYGGGTWDPAEEAAENYSYEHGVSFVAARGNEASDIDVYPACFSGSKLISIGASVLDKTKAGFSSYGKGIDLLAPGDFGLTYTTQYEGGYGYFAGTSAATPHVSGVVDLLMSYAYNHGWSNGLEPEDYEGMLKASAEDIAVFPFDDYKNGYDDKSGWGHLQADELFNMINVGYRITQFSSSENLQYGGWSGSINMYFVNDGRINKPLSTGSYYAYRRKVTGTITLPDNWIIDNEHNLYVWGRSGQGSNAGLSAAITNYQTGYTQVTDGTGDNDNKWADGIIHNNSLNVQACTYQYDVYDILGRRYGIYPSNAQIALNISVFGLEKYLDVSDDTFTENNDIILYPNPVKNIINLIFNSSKIGGAEIKIFNVIGEILFDKKFTAENFNNKLTINISNFDNGIYYLTYSSNGNVSCVKFTVY